MYIIFSLLMKKYKSPKILQHICMYHAIWSLKRHLRKIFIEFLQNVLNVGRR